MVYQCSPAVYLSLTFVLYLEWHGGHRLGSPRSYWLSACAVLLYAVLFVSRYSFSVRCEISSDYVFFIYFVEII